MYYYLYVELLNIEGWVYLQLQDILCKHVLICKKKSVLTMHGDSTKFFFKGKELKNEMKEKTFLSFNGNAKSTKILVSTNILTTLS